MRAVLILGALLLTGIAGAAERPNILFIMADDLGAADLSVYGRRDYTTPNLDSIARDGVRFTDAYANSADDTGTRTALITGRYQYRYPVGLEEPLTQRPVGLEPDVVTLPSLLQQAGYETALVGKWHLGNLPNYGPDKSGYKHFWGYRSEAIDYFTHKNNDGQYDLWSNNEPTFEDGYLTDLVGNHAIDLIKEMNATGNPFFLSVHFNAPHWPWTGPDDVEESIRLDQIADQTLRLLHTDGGGMSAYAQMVQRLDDQVGAVLATLEQLGIADQTIVVFTSDNGGERFSDNWPHSGMKTELLEGGIRVPVLVRWPGVAASNTVNQSPIMSIDWMPTFLAAAGVEQPLGADPFDGVDITTAIAGNELAERTLFWRFKHLNQAAVRKGDYKYLRIANYDFLFNLKNDPGERVNLKNREPTRYTDLLRAWVDWNAGMLPIDNESFSRGINGRQLADHFGVEPGAAQLTEMGADRNSGEISGE